MDVLIVLTIGEAIAGAIGGIIIGRRLEDSSFGNVVNAFIGVVGGVTVGYLLAITLPDLAILVSKGSLGAILASSIGALVGAGVLIVICALVKDNVWGATRID
ncbi:hypothetical protein V4R08_16310 (plasmid) [Nitrobacter sp. NHB1]|uniref:hypothetical protein n=1 Tax=Nitrobacter sp. NHB1 TaxID=3119830 RepID=UPI0030007B05